MPENLTTRKTLLVLGCGYVGKAVSASCSSASQVVLTSRSGKPGAAGNVQAPRLFDISKHETWNVVEAFEHIVWTFPSATTHTSIRLAINFFEEMQLKNKKVMILGSTSCFSHKTCGELVDETFPLDLSQPRVVAEEQLRQRSALILCLAGIYGPGRDPAEWLGRRLVTNGESYINLIHIHDIVKIIECWQNSPNSFSGQRIIASDGRHRRWKDVFAQMCQVGTLSPEVSPFDLSLAESASSKRMNNTLLKQKLYSGPFHCYPEDGL